MLKEKDFWVGMIVGIILMYLYLTKFSGKKMGG